jgi:hypothetical protein
MLTLFRIVFPPLVVPNPSLVCGRAVVGAGPGGARLIAEGVLKPDRGVPGADFGVFGIFPVLLRVLLTGKAGKAMLGGPRDGRDGRGNAVVIVDVANVEKEDERKERSQVLRRRPGARSM